MQKEYLYKKGRIPWNKGKKMSVETKKKIGEANSGKKRTDEFKIKMSNRLKDNTYGKALKGIKRSEETKKKMSDARKGAGSPFWRGGVSPANRLERERREIKIWKMAVFSSDDWTCKKCKRRRKKGDRVVLNAHHIKNFSKYVKLRFDISNGITFCKECHLKFHKKYGFENNNIKQVKEYLYGK